MRNCFCGAALLALTLISVVARADESKVELSAVPKGGVDAVKAMFPGAEITGAAKETEDGKTFFEVTLKQKGKNIDVTVSTDGTIELVEKEIASADLPAVVKKALDAKYPKATYKIVEEVSNVKDGKSKLDFFEAQLVTANNETLEVQVAPDGKIKKEEKKTEKD